MTKNKKTEKVIVNDKQAQVIREALEKHTQVDKDWFDKHVIVEVV